MDLEIAKERDTQRVAVRAGVVRGVGRSFGNTEIAGIRRVCAARRGDNSKGREASFPPQRRRPRRSAARISAPDRFDTSAAVTSSEPWKVPGNWCSSTETPCSRSFSA